MESSFILCKCKSLGRTYKCYIYLLEWFLFVLWQRYLHEVCQPPIVHQNFTSANVLLDDGFAVRVSDCGLAPLISSNYATQVIMTKKSYNFVDQSCVLEISIALGSSVLSRLSVLRGNFLYLCSRFLRKRKNLFRVIKNCASMVLLLITSAYTSNMLEFCNWKCTKLQG